MSIDDQELRAIQFLAERIRKNTPGAGLWDSAGFAANLRKLAGRNLHMTVEHVIRHAADPNAKTPGVLLGAYTPEAPSSAGKPHPPKAKDQCRRCGLPKPCACEREQLAYDHNLEPHREHIADDAITAALASAKGADVVRAVLRARTNDATTTEETA